MIQIRKLIILIKSNHVLSNKIFLTQSMYKRKVAKSVTFDLLFLEMMIIIFIEHSNIATIRVCILSAS